MLHISTNVIKMTINIETKEHFTEVMAENSMVLVDFYADWCEPCKWLDKVLIELDNNLGKTAVVAKVNTEKLPSISTENHVQSVPVLILFKRGKEVWRMNGFMMAGQLLEKIREFSRET